MVKNLVFFLFSLPLLAQTNDRIIYVVTAPSGTCTARAQLRYLVPTGVLYGCKANVWTILATAGGGSGTVTSFSGTGPSWLTWTVATATTTPAVTLAPTTAQTAHQVIGTCNAATTFAPCTLVAGDLPATTTLTVASGAKALLTGAIGSAACTAAQTATATGTLTTDTIAATFNGDPTAVTGYVPLTTGMLTIIPYPTTDTVNFKVCNNTSASITPGAITLNWRVTR